MDKTQCHYRPKRRKPGFNEDMFKETSYYFKDGLRYVYPYSFTFTAYVKKRWLNLTVLDLFSKEFHMETVDYYKRAIKNGKIKVNNQTVMEDQQLVNNDILRTTIHRHEPPVRHQDIEFLQNDDEMVVINKPPSIPVHPCGRYRHNTIVFLLGKDHDLKGLHTIHRIDRLTSGVLMFARTIAKAKEMEKLLHEKQCVEKEYFARVVGEFPDDEIVVDEPVLTASHKIGVCHVHKDGKICLTKFKRLSFNGKSSVVSCKPKTGRMHQIRVHLQWLGYPIVNDPIYNHPTAWGDKTRKNEMNEVINELLRTRKDKSYDGELSTDKYDMSLGDGKDDVVISSNPKRRKIESSENTDDKEEVEHEVENESIDNNVKNELSNCSNAADIICSPIVKTCNENNETKSRNDEEVSCTSSDIDTHDKEIYDTNKEIIDDNAKNELSNCSNVNNINSPEIKTVEENKKPKSSNVIIDTDERLSYMSSDIGEEYVDSECTDCKRVWKQPLLSEMVMYLHSFHYKGPDWEYITTVPEWAKEDWNEE